MMYAKKSLGQNFLVDKNIIKKIISILPEFNDSVVIEVGPGKGALTKELIKKAKKVIAIEIDHNFIDILSKIKNNNLVLIHDDILKVDFKKIFNEKTSYHFVSNLPYYIATKIIFTMIFIEKVNTISIMLQKELVDRILSKPNNRLYGRLTVAINSLFIVKNKINVSKNSFSPKPKVDSTFLVLEKKKVDFDIAGYLLFVKQCFALKRKTLLNSLKKSNEAIVLKVEEWLLKKNYDKKIRAEQISIFDYIDLYNYLYN